MVEVRARGKLIPFPWPAFMLARFHGEANCASKEKTRAAADRQGPAGRRPYAAGASNGTRRMGGQAKGSAHQGRSHPPPGRTRAKGKGQMTNPARPASRPWTQADDDKLRALVFTRASTREIARQLDRPIFAIRSRAQQLHIILKKVTVK